MSKWIEPINHNPNAKVRVVCFHHSGGGASTFYPWRHSLHPFIELIAIQLPGRETRLNEPLLTSMEMVVERLVHSFSLLSDKPLFLFGHSMGGLIAYEIAKKLQLLFPSQPHHLIVSGCRPPHVPSKHRNHLLPKEAFISKLLEYNGTPKEVFEDDSLLDLLLPILRADFTIAETYHSQIGSLLNCKIIALGGLQDPYIKINELEAWAQHTNKHFKCYSFPGGHFFIKNAQAEIISMINEIAYEFR